MVGGGSFALDSNSYKASGTGYTTDLPSFFAARWKSNPAQGTDEPTEGSYSSQQLGFGDGDDYVIEPTTGWWFGT